MKPKMPTLLSLEDLALDKLIQPDKVQAAMRAVAEAREESTPGITCICCGLAISEQMIRNSEERARQSKKKPAHTMRSGVFEGGFLCKPCFVPGEHLLALNTAQTPDVAHAALDAYRANVMTRFIRVIAMHSGLTEEKTRSILSDLNFGNWKPHMRMPDIASGFWVLMKLLGNQRNGR